MERVRTLLKGVLLHSAGRNETIAIGRSLGRRLRAGDVVVLEGPLGSGKTTFAKGLALGLGVAGENEVKSPTFVFLHIYRAAVPIYHLDFFRLEAPAEVETLGWDDLLAGDGVVVVEWPEKIGPYLPADALRVRFSPAGENARRIAFDATGPRSGELVRNLGKARR
jgi:tRNA threonylcarbamoyladenosine biosynthesis protein TsaE